MALSQLINEMKKKYSFKEGYGLYREDYPQKINLTYTPLTESWRKRCDSTKQWWSDDFIGTIVPSSNHIAFTDITLNKNSIAKVYQYEKLMELKKRLLSFGGDMTCLPTQEDDIIEILNRGQFWIAKKNNIERITGEICQCHKNSCRLYEENKEDIDIRICTGYALSPDGLWRQHSWLVTILNGKAKIIETTIKWLCYYGYVMTEKECEDFCDKNY